MNEPIIIALVASLPGVLGAAVIWWKAKKAIETTSRSEALKVEAGAFGRAQKIYEDGIRQLEDQVKALRRQVSDEQDVSTSLRRRIRDLEDTLDRMRTQLIRAGVELLPLIEEQEAPKA